MLGDYTKVPLKRDERWTGAMMQQGRVLLDHEWNLNVEAAARAAQHAAADLIGPAGVPAGSPAFQVTAVSDNASPPHVTDLVISPGRIWVGGLEAVAPAQFTYHSQDRAPQLPHPITGAADAWRVYLDVFPEHVQPAEDGTIVDPAIAPVESAARTRVGYRVVVDNQDPAPPEAVAQLTITSVLAKATADTEPMNLFPDGLFRVEVLDNGRVEAASSARIVWSFENGAAAAAVMNVIDNRKVQLVPGTGVKFAVGDLVEVSWLARRADRADHGPQGLFKIMELERMPAGDLVTLDQDHHVTDLPRGLVLRRWDGQTPAQADLTAPIVATFPSGGAAVDVGVTLTLTPGVLHAGDWWGASIRHQVTPVVGPLTKADPDGVPHSRVLLATIGPDIVAVDHRPVFDTMVNLTSRPAPLVRSTCTVIAHPADQRTLAQAVAALLPDGGELCLAAGTWTLDQTISVVGTGRERIAVQGVGPATIINATVPKVFDFQKCASVEFRDLQVTAPIDAQTPVTDAVGGALNFGGCGLVGVRGCELTLTGSNQGALLTIGPSADGAVRPGRVDITGNTFHLAGDTTRACYIGSVMGPVVLRGNHVESADGLSGLARVLASPLVEVLDNTGADMGYAVDLSGCANVALARNAFGLSTSTIRAAINLDTFQSARVLDTTVTRPPAPAQGGAGVFMMDAGSAVCLLVQNTFTSGVQVGVNLQANGTPPASHLWVVSDTLSLGTATRAVTASLGDPRWLTIIRNVETGG